jgi:hypothetical protein
MAHEGAAAEQAEEAEFQTSINSEEAGVLTTGLY